VNALAAVLWKDLVSEWRSRDRLATMLVFSLLVVVIFRFVLPRDAAAISSDVAAGLLWVAFVFASLLGLGRSFALELENEALSGLALAPVNGGWIFLGKALANLLLLALVQAATSFFFALVFELDLGAVAAPLAGVALLGGVGLCSAGTLFAAIGVRTRFREAMLPLLLLPLLVPVVVGAVQATAELLATGTTRFAPVQLLLVTDAVFLMGSFVGFDYVLEE
jgi:heme exporter protein B